MKDEFGTAAASAKDPKSGASSASSSGRSVSTKTLAKKDSSEDGLEAYLEEAAGMVMSHRYERGRLCIRTNYQKGYVSQVICIS